MKGYLFKGQEFAVGCGFFPAVRFGTSWSRVKLAMFRGGFRRIVLALLGWVGVAEALGQAAAEPLHVEARILPGTYFVGQGFELQVKVIAAQRPRIELPRIDGALAWKIQIESGSISETHIGSVVAEKLFVARFRLVAQRPGTLEVPSIRAHVGNRSGQSQPIRVVIHPLPVSGRAAEFLGGVGPFTLVAEASPRVVRVGQELEYRIKVTGPAAWGMNGHPDLSRFARLGLGLRIVSRPDEIIEEPPERTYVYRLRPTRAGEKVLPPVAVVAFDPTISRYVTRVTSSVPIRAVAVPAFDPASIDGGGPKLKSARSAWAAWTIPGVLLAGTFAALVWVRRRTRQRPLLGPAAARRYAARLARSYASAGSRSGAMGASAAQPASNGELGSSLADATAQRVSDELVHYLEIGLGRPAGALTPDEAWQGVAGLTGSHNLARQAGRLAARCDRVLYGDQAAEEWVRQLRENARLLFEALGRIRTSHTRPP